MGRSVKTRSAKPCLSNAIILDNGRTFAHNASMLKSRRAKLNLTQEQLANDLGVSRRSIQYYEAGQSPKHKRAKEAIEGWLKAVEHMERKGI